MIKDFKMSLLIQPKLGTACYCDICDKVLYYNPYIHTDLLNELKEKYDIDIISLQLLRRVIQYIVVVVIMIAVLNVPLR